MFRRFIGRLGCSLMVVSSLVPFHLERANDEKGDRMNGNGCFNW